MEVILIQWSPEMKDSPIALLTRRTFAPRIGQGTGFSRCRDQGLDSRVSAEGLVVRASGVGLRFRAEGVGQGEKECTMHA